MSAERLHARASERQDFPAAAAGLNFTLNFFAWKFITLIPRPAASNDQRREGWKASNNLRFGISFDSSGGESERDDEIEVRAFAEA